MKRKKNYSRFFFNKINLGAAQRHINQGSNRGTSTSRKSSRKQLASPVPEPLTRETLAQRLILKEERAVSFIRAHKKCK